MVCHENCMMTPPTGGNYCLMQTDASHNLINSGFELLFRLNEGQKFGIEIYFMTMSSAFGLKKKKLTCSRGCVSSKYVMSCPFIEIFPLPGDLTVTSPRAFFRKHSTQNNILPIRLHNTLS